MPPNSLRTVFAQLYRRGSRQAARTFSALPPHIGKGYVGSRRNIFSQQKRLFSSEPATEVPSDVENEKLHLLDFFCSVIERISERGEEEVALRVYSLAKKAYGVVFPPHITTFLIKGLAKKKMAEESKKLLLEMINGGAVPGSEVFNAVVYACARIGDPGGSTLVLKLMENCGLVPDVYTFTSVINAFAKAGDMSRALEVLAEAKKKHSKLTPVTYEVLIEAFFKAELYQHIMQLFEDRGFFGVKPSEHEYTRLVRSFCLVEMDWRSADRVHMEMRRWNFSLDPISLNLIASLRLLDPSAPKGQYDTSLSYFAPEFTTAHAESLAALSEMSRLFFVFLFKISPRLGVQSGRALLALDNARTVLWETIFGRSSRSDRKEDYDQEQTATRLGTLLGLILLIIILPYLMDLHESRTKLKERLDASKLEEDEKKREVERVLKTASLIRMSLAIPYVIPSVSYVSEVWEAQRARLQDVIETQRERERAAFY